MAELVPLGFVRAAGETRRFHTIPVLRVQNVAEHSWHVAMLINLIYGGCQPGVRLPLIMAALTHDMAECRVGDLPAPAKRGMDQFLELKDGAKTFREAWGVMEQSILREVGMDWEYMLEPWEIKALKLCDSLDGMLYCIRERQMGNQLIAECYENFKSYVTELLGEREDAEVPFPGDEEEITAEHVAWDLYDHAIELWESANG